MTSSSIGKSPSYLFFISGLPQTCPTSTLISCAIVSRWIQRSGLSYRGGGSLTRRCLVIRQETHKLLSAGHIREIQYPEWLANVVLVKKANGKWRMCVDFMDLNKACPKDSYPLPNANALVDSTSGCRLLSFLDAFSG